MSLTLLQPVACSAADVDDSVIVNARDAWRAGDKTRLAAAKSEATGHPLAMWVDYWELNARLSKANADEVEAFFARWPDTYVEDRLRNDWLLELGRRRDWARFNQTWPRYRMRDDREVACYAHLAKAGAGEPLRDAAKQAWFDQREADDGCAQLGTALRQAHQLSTAEVWRKLRGAVEANRVRQSKQTAALLSDDAASAVAEILDNPTRAMGKHKRALSVSTGNMQALALMRIAASDPDAAANLMTSRWQRMLSHDAAGWVWACIGKQSAQKLQAQAPGYFERAWASLGEKSTEPDAMESFISTGDITPDWGDELLAWQARAAIRAATADDTPQAQVQRRWSQLLQAVDAMSPELRNDPAWVYWRARALMAQPAPQPEPASKTTAAAAPLPAKLASAASAPSAPPAPPAPPTPQQQAQAWLASIASPYSFYGLLALEDLNQAPNWSARGAPLTPAELNQARTTPGLARGIQLIQLGLRSEGTREWNYTLGFVRPGGMSDRELLAAAQFACDQQVWDRCINASDRTRAEFDLNQRYPTPFRASLGTAARDAKVDLAYVYGLTRQESRFISAAKSSVGASGLMQVMPATAKWTAKKLGIPVDAERLHDPQTNVLIGVGYLKLVLDNFGGAQALAAAAYNAGPARPRRWREGSTVDAAAWVETIPFNETRDYVKRVLANSCAYAAVLGSKPTSIKTRLGSQVGPRLPATPPPDADLP
jgi:soluble lytic murein transglycosylase